MINKPNCTLKKNQNNLKCKKEVGEGVFSIIIPKGDNSRNKIKHKEYDKYLKQIHKHFGGSTVRPATVGCYNQKDKIYCEQGFIVQAFRDFDTPYQKNNNLRKKNVIERQKQLKNDYLFMKKQASKIAKSFGQDSVPTIYDNVSDVSYLKGNYRNKIKKNRTKGRLSEKPFEEYI